MSIQFSTAELFQTSSNGAMPQIRKGRHMKLNKNNHHNHHQQQQQQHHQYHQQQQQPQQVPYHGANYRRRRHNPQDSTNFVNHVPHNSKDEHFRFYDDIGRNNIFDEQHINDDYVAQNEADDITAHNDNNNNNNSHHGHHTHTKHNVSVASLTHNRGNTFSKYLLDDTLQVIDGDIPSQKKIMKDFVHQRVTNHLQQQSSHFEGITQQHQMIDEDYNNNNNNNNYVLDDFGGTMREISNVTTPLDEAEMINFGDFQDIDIPDYTDDDEEEKGIDPMQLIAAKNSLKSKHKKGFPDTQPITSQIAHKKRKRRRHNTQRSPLPQIGDMTPSSVVIKQSDSDEDTYDDNSSDDSEPQPNNSRGSQRVIEVMNNNNVNKHQKFPLRSGTMTNIAKLMSSAKKANEEKKDKMSKHRHSRSEVPKSFIKKNELFEIYQRNSGIHSAKQYLANVTKIAKTNQASVEKKALKEMEKKYKPQLQKTQQELEDARRKSLKQQEEMKDMKRELDILRKELQNDEKKYSKPASDKKVIKQKLREKNLEIQELQSKLKFEKHRHQMILPHNHAAIASPIIYTNTPSLNLAPDTSLISAASAPDAMQAAAKARSARSLLLKSGHTNDLTINNMKKSKSSAGLFEGLNRLKVKNSAHSLRAHKYISMKDLKKRKSLPEELAKKHKRPLWTHRSAMKKSKTLEMSLAANEDENRLKMKRFGIKNRLIKKRESLLLPPNTMRLKMRINNSNNSSSSLHNNNNNNNNNNNFFFDRNLIKRNSWHDGDKTNNKELKESVDYDKLKDILVAAQRKNAASKSGKNAAAIADSSDSAASGSELNEKYKDIVSKYQHLLKENEHLRKENFGQKDELKKYKAPIPKINDKESKSINTSIPNAPVLFLKKKKKAQKPTASIERKRSSKKKKNFVARKRLKEIPSRAMMKIDWIPIENDVIKDTRWRYIDDSDIFIPKEFESLFCVESKEEEESKTVIEKEIKIEKENISKSESGRRISHKRESSVIRMLSQIKLTPHEIRDALLSVNVDKLSDRNLLYNLLSAAPNLHEQKYVQNRVNNSLSLSAAEQFFYQLSDINHLELRLQLILFKCTFSSTMSDIYNDLFILNDALKSIQRSSNLERILTLILSFGNFLNADSSSSASNSYGIHGFELISLDAIGAKHVDFLCYLCKYCSSNACSAKYQNCIAKCCLELNESLSHPQLLSSSIKSYECYQKILLITEELSKFGRSLRKFRKQAIATKTDANKKGKQAAYKQIENDLFEQIMRDFLRKAHLVCKHLLDLHQEIVAIADIISSQYNYNLNRDCCEELLQIFAKFIANLKYAQNKFVQQKHSDEEKLLHKKEFDAKCRKLGAKLARKRKMSTHKPYFIYSSDDLEAREREKEEKCTKISKLIYQHAILMDLDAFSQTQNQTLTVQRIKYLKGLSKSKDLPNQLSNNPEAIQKERRRRRSLTNTDIQIGSKMAMTLAEDIEMK